MLRGEEIDPEIDERSGYEVRQSISKDPHPVTYNPAIPIETFDFIITDTAQRGRAFVKADSHFAEPAFAG